MAEIKEIGIVHSKFSEPADPFVMQEEESRIEVFDEFSDGLFGIEENTHLQIIFHLHRSRKYRLRSEWYYGGERGVFACRSPHRPGAVGVTEVKLIERKGNTLIITGFDALDGTPVLDIKPMVTRSKASSPADGGGKSGKRGRNFEIRYPRAQITQLIKTGKLEDMLLEAGKLHGHYCPGLAMGIIAAYHGMLALAKKHQISPARLQNSEGMEEMMVIIENNSCFTDGIQYVSGCTLGNNGLIYHDFGKTAVTFFLRHGKLTEGVRLVSNGRIDQVIRAADPRFEALFTSVVKENDRDPELLKQFKEVSAAAAFSIVSRPWEELFRMEIVPVEVPDYAPIRKSLICSLCGEEFMQGKEAQTDPNVLCASCAGAGYAILDGQGMHPSKK